MSIEQSDNDAIVLKDIGVRYRVPSERIATLKEHVIRRILGRRIEYRELWALRDVNLQVKRGEALGIIGRNGAGKSTLLKVVARVLRPTLGSVWIRGNTSALLELGGGFHPELTGRENVILKGALLGFSNTQMRQKMDSILEFAELADFIDSPLRIYSSGMVARLGFAVATDVDPDVLIVDEVLAVGDESFRKKSLARMQNFLEVGTTILLVSHSLKDVRELCSRAIWIHEGRIRDSGPAEQVIEAYLAHQ